ncbi:cell envelope biogenesis protein OmpA [Croceivirga lutea]|uniref:OmpA family protein n=1 Tax=Croceivirga lutea TaxID=1775167 RepID=UPI00163AA537|nr:OmpA family protein [Croceivirga lutea]GGG38896.1 cell envelope biogenesis protein OmpA [Croceivirga lutea]
MRLLFVIILSFLSHTVVGQTITSLDIDESELQSNSAIAESSSKSIFSRGPQRWLEDANYYFENNWYVKAAELYIQSLEQYESLQSQENLERLGKCLYELNAYEDANFWYNILFGKFKETASLEAKLNYIHTLKAVGQVKEAETILRSITKEKLTESVKDFSPIFQNEYVVKNLKSNSKYSDFSPTYIAKNKVVFASARDSGFLKTRRYKRNNQPFLNLYAADENQENKELQNVRKFSSNINSKFHEAALAITPDGKTIFFTRNNYKKKLRKDKKGTNHLNLFVSKLIDGNWSTPERVPFNSDNYSVGHPTVSLDGKKLYFVSDMPGGYGETDIYQVNILDDGTYSEPINLGAEVNSKDKEMFPFVSNNRLYFSSNKADGFGGLDVYISNFVENKYSNPINLGEKFNSNRDDFSFVVDENNEKGYFASNRKGGKGDDDIYHFYLHKKAKSFSAIVGNIYEQISGDKIEGVEIELYDDNNNLLETTTTTSSGVFTFKNLEQHKSYTIKTTSEQYLQTNQSVYIADQKRVMADVPLKTMPTPEILLVGKENIYFDFDSSKLNNEAIANLQEILALKQQYPNMRIEIASYTDSRGSNLYNQKLSERRAESTQNYLLEHGIQTDRIIKAIGYGEEKLVNGCDDNTNCREQAHRLNRRSEIIIYRE